ncbi:hypothetical protein AB0O64_16235 [Streptomyces sp. NPDC088341]|uniref:hypothetical protein n=1 Tax=Streptomyces sp. NPDC088341 TaxID=3154870 RepID=UPI00343C8618
MTRMIATAVTSAVLLVGGAAATSAAAEPAAASTAKTAEAAPLALWSKAGNFPYTQCVNWGNTMINTGQALAWQCVPIGLGIYELWLLR